MAVVVNVYGKADMAAIDKAQKSLDGLRAEAETSSGGLSGAFSRMGSAVTSTAAKIASALAATKIALWLKDSVQAAANEQVAQKMLQTSVIATGGSWKTYSETMEKATTAASSLSGYTKTELTSTLGKLTTITGSAKGGIDTLGAAMNLARNQHMDLASAAKMVGRAYDGNVTALKRIGIELPKNATGMEAINALQKRVGGSAKAYGDTAQGSMDKFRAAMEQVQVMIGDKLIPALQAGEKWVGKIATAFMSLPGPVKDAVLAIAGIAAAALILAPFVSAIMSVGAAFSFIASPVGLIIVAIAAVSVGLYEAYQHSQTFRDIVQAAFSVVRGVVVTVVGILIATFNDLKTAYQTVSTLISTSVATISAAWNAIKAAAIAVWDWLVDAFKKYGLDVLAALGGPIGILVLELAKHWSQVKADAVNAWNAVIQFLQTLPGKIGAVFAGAAAWLVNAGKNVIDGLYNGVKNAWSTASTWLSGIKGRILSAVGSLGNLLYSVGSSIVDGLVSGISSAWHKVTDTLGKLVGGLGGLAKKALGINSPSKVFQEHGASIAEGLAMGMDSGRSLVNASLLGLVGNGPSLHLGGAVGRSSSSPVSATAPSLAASQAITINVVLPGGTALIGTARQVGETLAPHIAAALARRAADMGRSR